MGKIGPTELIIVLILALVIFGPAKLPSIGKSIGVAINEFKTSMNKVSEDLTDTAEEETKKHKS